MEELKVSYPRSVMLPPWRTTARPPSGCSNTPINSLYRSPFNLGYNSRPRFKRIGGFQVRIVYNKELYKDLASQAICSIERPKLESDENVDITFTEFQPITSYTWVDRKEPLILVPGKHKKSSSSHPRVWTNEPLPFKIDKDEGTVFIHQNSSQLGTSPLLPLIVAVNHHDPNFRMGDMDYITDRNGLRKLYRWVNQVASWSTNHDAVGQTFRIDVELVGRTILLQRWEAEATQLGGPGYEKNFQKHTTSQIPECEAGTGHHRIVTFTFGKQKILMRCTTDACLPVEEEDQDRLDKITKNFPSMNLYRRPSSRVRKVPTYKDEFLSVQTMGKLVPQESIIELKTKGEIVNPTCYDDQYVQLLFAQIPNLYTGRHRQGEFYMVEKTSMDAIKEKAGDTMDDSLKLLKKLLEDIQRVVFESIEGGGSLSIVVRNGMLKVFKREGENGLLPKNILDFIH